MSGWLANSRSKLERRRGVHILRSSPGARGPSSAGLGLVVSPTASNPTIVRKRAMGTLGALVKVERSADLLPGGGMGESTVLVTKRVENQKISVSLKYLHNRICYKDAITFLESACISASHHMTTLSCDLFVFLEDNKQGNL